MKFNSPKEAYEWAKEHGPSDESREVALNDPSYAFLYARLVDGHPRDDTREASLKAPSWAYWYALEVDGHPRDDTRKAVLSSPEWATTYAVDVDGKYREDTLRAALKTPETAYRYARELGIGNDVIRKAVLESPLWTYEYVKNIEGGRIHPEVENTMRPFLLTGDEWAIKLFKEFGDVK